MDKKTFSRIVSAVSAAAIGCSWTLGAIPPAAAAAQQEISAENAQEEQLIPVIVKLKGDSVLASDQAADMGAEFIDSPQAEKIGTVIESLQDRAEGYLRQLYPDLEIGFRYSLVFNGFSCQLPESVIEEAKSSPLIEDICPSCTYSAPKPMMTESGSMAGVPEFQEITGATGEGELIAILDTELNTAHSMFMAIDALDNKLSKEQVSTLAKDKKFTSEVDPEKAYVSSKLPYVYDYSDDTPYEVADEDIYHGTHVAGIAAGNRTATPKGDPISGIAPDAQIAFMKIFQKEEVGDGVFESYCTDEAIAAALEDAVALKADVINMSLGSSNEGIQDIVYADIIKAVDNAGITLCAAAGNEGESYLGYDGPNITANVDTGTVNEPAIFPTVFSVASADNPKLEVFTFTAGGKKFTYVDGSTEHLCSELAGHEYQAVYVGEASVEDIGEADLTGKIALCYDSGGITYEEKCINAYNAGAVAVISCDSFTAPRSGVSNGDAPIPMASVLYEDGEILMGMSDVKVTFSDEDPVKEDLPPSVSSFSSSGVSSSLSIDPEIMGVGGDVLSASYYDGYEKLGGTSMATPYVAGCVAAADQYLKKQGLDLTGSEKTAYIKNLLMNSAVPYTYDGEFVSPRRQGAGLISLSNLLEDNVIVTGTNGLAKIELGDQLGDSFNFDIEIKNISDKTVDLGTPYLYLDSDSYYFSDTYSDFVITGTRSIDFTLEQTQLEPIPAGETAKVRFDVSLDPNFLKEYESHFLNGFFIEGFVYFAPNENCCPISIPLLGFHGDWADVPIFDDGLLAAPEFGSFAGSNELINDLPLGQLTLLINQLLDHEAASEDGSFNTQKAMELIHDDPQIQEKIQALRDGMIYISPDDDYIADTLAYSFLPLRQAKFSDIMIYNEQGELLTEYAPEWKPSHLTMVCTPSYDLTTLPEGKYTAEISAYIDYPGAEDHKQTISREFVVDKTAPKVTSVLEEKDGRKLLTVTASDKDLDALFINGYDPELSFNNEDTFEDDLIAASTVMNGENSFVFYGLDYLDHYDHDSIILDCLAEHYNNELFEYNIMDVILPEYSSDGTATFTCDVTGMTDYQITVMDRAMNSSMIYSPVDPEYALREGIWWGTSDSTDRYLYRGDPEGYGSAFIEQSNGEERAIALEYDGSTLSYTDANSSAAHTAQITWNNKNCFTAVWEDGTEEVYKYQSMGHILDFMFFSNDELVELAMRYEEELFGERPNDGEAVRGNGSEVYVSLYTRDSNGEIIAESFYQIDRFDGTFTDNYGMPACIADYCDIIPGVWSGSTYIDDYCDVRFFYFNEDGTGKIVYQTDKHEEKFTYELSGKNISFTFENGTEETHERSAFSKRTFSLDGFGGEQLFYMGDPQYFYFFSNEELGAFAYDYYEVINGQRPAQCTIRNINDGAAEISLFDEEGQLLEMYSVSTNTANGTDQNGRYVYLLDPGSEDMNMGDVDGDGVIDATDASAVLTIYAANQTGEPLILTDREQTAANVNGDQYIDATDASAILSYYSYTQTGGTADIVTFISEIMLTA